MADEDYDEAELDEDWIKTLRWDVWAGDKLLDTLDELKAYLGVATDTASAQQEAVRAFTERPAWQKAPDQLRQQVEGFLE